MAFADLKGDVLAAQGKPVEARAAYEAALAVAASSSDAQLRELLQAKMDALGASK